MTGFVTALLLLLPLASPFGEATATASSVEDGLRLDVSVEVEGSPVAVLVRGLGAGAAELPPVALANRGDGTWEGIVQLTRVENIRIGFESIPQRGPATVSELHLLTDLGVDRGIFTLDRVPTAPGEDDDPLGSAQGQRWGWLGLAAGAAALTLIAVWAIDSYKSKPDEDGDSVIVDGTSDDAVDPIVD